MRDAKLIGADLTGTDFQSADLSGANLSNAQMSSAVFKDADLSGATLDGARFQDTVFQDANLDGAKIDTMDMPLDWATGNGREVALALLQEHTNRSISINEINRLRRFYLNVRRTFLQLKNCCFGAANLIRAGRIMFDHRQGLVPGDGGDLVRSAAGFCQQGRSGHSQAVKDQAVKLRVGLDGCVCRRR